MAATALEGWDSAAVGNSPPLVLAGAAAAVRVEEAGWPEAAMVEHVEVVDEVGQAGAVAEAAAMVEED